MDQNERIRTEIEAKLSELDKSINELTQQAEHQKEKYSAVAPKTLEEILEKRREAARKLKAWDESEHHQRKSLLYDLQHFMADMDKELRQALAYFS